MRMLVNYGYYIIVGYSVQILVDMFIVYGKKVVARKRGFLAEFCPSCQQVRRFRLLRNAVVDHLYWAPINDGQTLGHSIRCDTCSREFAVEATNYPEVCRKKNTPLPELTLITNPLLADRNGVLASQESRMRTIREPFLRFNESLLDRFLRGTMFDWLSTLSLLAIPASFFITGWLGRQIDTLGRHGFLTGFAGFVASVVLVCFVASGEPKRFFRKKILPQLVAELRSFHVDDMELRELFRRFKARNYAIAKVTRPESISLALKLPDRIQESATVLRSA